MKFIIATTVIVASTALLIACGLLILLLLSKPRLVGKIFVRGIKMSICIQRDTTGIPTIMAHSRADASFALGFIHAQERFFQMDVSRRIGLGELAELLGKSAIKTDCAMRAHRTRELSRRVEQSLKACDRHLLEAYASGVNAGLRELRAMPFEYCVLRRK